ncbi:dihydrofolate reductase family protein [Draconibacterium sp.]
MRKIKLYIATSLNGKIAKPDGSVDWLEYIPNPEKTDYGYAEFFDSIDTTIQGYNTYNQIINWDIEFPYKGKKNFVLTKKQNIENTEFVDFITENHVDFITDLKRKGGGDIWLIGGGQANTLILNAGLLDEIQIFVMPIILSGGIDLFDVFPTETQLKLLETKSYSSGVVEMRYKVG